MKPIEKGCMAIIVKGSDPSSPATNVGKLVIVGKFTGSSMGAKRHCFYTDLWEVNIRINYGRSGYHYYMSEHGMQRIDEDESNDESRKVHQNVGVVGGNGRR